MNRSLFAPLFAASALALSSVAAEAAPPRTELLAERANAGAGYGAPRHDPDVRFVDDRDRRWGRGYDEPRGYRDDDYRFDDRRRYDEDRAMAKARRYASIAVDQARQARRMGIYPDHPRWSLNFDRHCRWALHADPWKLEREIRRRDRQLREWRRYGYGYGYGHGYRHGAPHDRH